MQPVTLCSPGKLEPSKASDLVNIGQGRNIVTDGAGVCAINSDLLKSSENVEIYREDFHRQRISLEGPERIQGYWDCNALRRVVENLCANAIKYGDGTAIRVSFGRKSHHKIFISVHNKGSFIPLEDQGLIFDQFARLSSSKTGSKEGWGIGLAIVKGIAEAHRGSARVDSSPTEGTTFTVELPTDSRDTDRLSMKTV